MVATPILPATSVTYQLLAGSLPAGLSISTSGIIYGTPEAVTQPTTSTFVIRATDNTGNISDRTFSCTISTVVSPQFVTPGGRIANILDSVWFEYTLEYSNPIPTNEVRFRYLSGSLPPGIEINEYGILRGYAEPPILNVNVESVVTTATTITDNVITCLSTDGFAVGRPVLFDATPPNTVFGGIVESQTYYIKSILNGTDFTISGSGNGTTLPLTNGTGYMAVILPTVTVGEPTIRTYTFNIQLYSELGNSIQTYSIQVTNQNLPAAQGGPGSPSNSRTPTILNTRPLSFDITSDVYYRYYSFPDDTGNTYLPEQYANIGQFTSDDVFNFKVIGKDFDNNVLEYIYTDLPLGLTGNVSTGWITGTPQISENTYGSYSFGVSVRKKINPTITTPTFNFTLNVVNGVSSEIVWSTPTDLGTIYNGTISTLVVNAESTVDLQYRLVSGELPPNLSLLSSGELCGVVSFQPATNLLDSGDSTTFEFEIEAYSTEFPTISSTKTFTVTVYQEFATPFDTLYIKCSPSVEDRLLINSLLSDESLIPSEFLYRSADPNFGKASNVIYQHAYGIHASDFTEYFNAIQTNHYWRNIVLGELKTAIARKEGTDEILYEVVYSQVIDNLVNYRGVHGEAVYPFQSNVVYPEGQSVSKSINWPRPIPIGEGEYVNTVYPNSLPNMRKQVQTELGQTYNYKALPLWMSSQQRNGSTIGFTPAWVIAYCKPEMTSLNGEMVSYAEYIKYQINNNWKNEWGNNLSLNKINFTLDRITVNKSNTYDFNNLVTPPSWIGLPSATPSPDPTNTYDFNVLFPQKTILPPPQA